MGAVRRIVVKIGSSLLTESSGRLSRSRLAGHVAAIAELTENYQSVILVTSGAIAAGFEKLGYTVRPTTINARQASAAVGQGLLIQAYAEEFARFDRTVAQVLLSRSDFSGRESYRNALAALELLTERRAIPIINENDTVSVEEITFGDNDMLAALVASLVHADQLLIITDIDGLYDRSPSEPGSRRIPEVQEITEDIMSMAGGSESGVGTGGMRSKLRAARFALQMGIEVFVGRYEGSDGLVKAATGRGSGTYFRGKSSSKQERKKQWIAFHSEPKGALVIDAGAVDAIVNRGKSLLPAGIAEVIGDFESEEVIELRTIEGSVIGRGIVQHPAEALRRVRGASSAEVKERLGTRRVEAVHRDSAVVYAEPQIEGEA